MLKAGSLFHGRYRVIRPIKSGGAGAVYEVNDEVTNRRRALKVMLPLTGSDASLVRRFEQEAKITGRIESDHIVHVSDAGVDEGSNMPFVVMELLQGDEMGTLSRRRGPLPAVEVVLYLSQVALALEKTHAAGIIHRDLKPENLFCTQRDDGSASVKILDFGAAKTVVHHNLMERTAVVGTPIYMAPEQIRGDGSVGPPVDIYALGHVAYSLLAGEPYWGQEARFSYTVHPLFLKILAGAPEPASVRAARRGVTLPAAFDAWFARVTALDPRDRPERAPRVVQALAEALSVPVPRSIQGRPSDAPPSWSPRRLAAAGASPPPPAPISPFVSTVDAPPESVRGGPRVPPPAPSVPRDAAKAGRAEAPQEARPSGGERAGARGSAEGGMRQEVDDGLRVGPRSRRPPKDDTDERDALLRDPLTQVYTERYLKTQLEKDYIHARKNRGRLAVLVFEIERDPKAPRDEALAKMMTWRLADALRTYRPKGACLAILGKETFVMLIPGAGRTRSTAIANAIAPRVQERLTTRKNDPPSKEPSEKAPRREGHRREGQRKEPVVKLRIGAARLEDADTSGRDMLDRAIAAMREGGQ